MAPYIAPGLEVVAMLVFLAIGVTQVVVPLMRGTPLFPRLRKHSINKGEDVE